jgi:hypothetical protein
MLKNSTKISHYLSNLWMNISGEKWIVYQAKKFSIRSLFVSIWFKIDQIVCAWLNIAVTLSEPHKLKNYMQAARLFIRGFLSRETKLSFTVDVVE